MADTSLLGYLGVIMTVLVVGVALAGLVLKLHSDTNRRIDDTNKRIDDTNKRIDELPAHGGNRKGPGPPRGLLGRPPPNPHFPNQRLIGKGKGSPPKKSLVKGVPG